MMASSSSSPLVTTELRRRPSPPSSEDDGHGSTRPSGGGGRRHEETLNWCAWAHQGHRLWEAMPDSFWVYTYKVERCPFPGTHVWASCPYAHRGERARRRDPRGFPYAAAPCAEYAESRRRLRLAGSSAAPACPRGLRCGYAHSVFETWLHPTRFRTVMCERGAQCTRPICFFAHAPAQRRREDDDVPLVVFPVTASFVPRLDAASAAFSSSSSRSLTVVARRPVDRVTEQGCSVRLLTRRSDDAAAAASSSSSSSLAVVAASTAPALPLLRDSNSPSTWTLDDEDIDFIAMVTRCCLASEAESKAEGSGYYPPSFDLMGIVRR